MIVEGVDKESADGMNNSSSPSCWIVVIDGVGARGLLVFSYLPVCTALGYRRWGCSIKV
jgi:hypothetical protein